MIDAQRGQRLQLSAPQELLTRRLHSHGKQKTPDLAAISPDGRAVLCDVKTINISEEELGRRYQDGVGEISDKLDDGFFKKLQSDLMHARAQIVAYPDGQFALKIAYVIVNFDDNLHEYVEGYRAQIDAFMLNNAVADLDVVFDIGDAFVMTLGVNPA
jgi:hypothetical protein